MTLTREREMVGGIQIAIPENVSDIQIAAISANVLQALNPQQVNLFISILQHYNPHTHQSDESRARCLLNKCPLGEDHPFLNDIDPRRIILPDIKTDIFVGPPKTVCPCCRH
jgi:hypothetical protein